MCDQTSVSHTVARRQRVAPEVVLLTNQWLLVAQSVSGVALEGHRGADGQVVVRPRPVDRDTGIHAGVCVQRDHCRNVKGQRTSWTSFEQPKKCSDAEQRCENYIQEIFTSLCLAYKCTLTAFRTRLWGDTTVQTTTSWIFIVCWLIIKNQYAKKQGLKDILKPYNGHSTGNGSFNLPAE